MVLRTRTQSSSFMIGWLPDVESNLTQESSVTIGLTDAESVSVPMLHGELNRADRRTISRPQDGVFT